tara:strand:- start:1046 stop:2005 length:960 start_codon:yes stop_codon:yes gene_type:complete
MDNIEKSMRYVVTGGAGFIGSNICKKIIENGDFVKVIDNLSTGYKKNIFELFENKNFEFVEMDLSDYAKLVDELQGYDCVIHLAALNSVPRSFKYPRETFINNLMGSINILEASRINEIKKVVISSSSSVYGDSEKLPKSEDMIKNPKSMYAQQKSSIEEFCEQYSKNYKMNITCLRYFNVFGPNQDPDSEYSAVIPLFIKKIMNKEEIIVNGSDQISRDFTYVDNVVNGTIGVTKSGLIGFNFFNLAAGNRITLKKMIELISKNLEIEAKVKIGPYRVGDIMHSMASITKLNEALKINEMISFEDGIKNTVKYFQEIL